MQIREDFKVDFDGWHKEANSLFKKALPMFVLISLIIPFLMLFSYYKSIGSILELRIINDTMLFAIAIAITCGVSFYVMFYLKRIDFNEKCSFLSIIKNIINTKSYLLEYSKIHSVFIFILCAMALISLISNIIEPKPINGELKIDVLTIINNTLISVYTSFFFLISVANLYALGIVYIGYGMVNKEGAKILTLQAINKYPELRFYLLKRNAVCGLTYICVFIFDLLIDNQIINIAIKIMTISLSSYVLTVYYIISRDLYGGKPNKQKVEQEDESLNALPTIV